MKTLTVIDSKFGRHRVYASQIVRPAGADVITGEMLPEIRRPNLQLACYALGVLHRYGLLHDYTHVCMVIVQPFLGHTDSYTCTIEELRETEAFLRERAIETRTNPTFRPSAKACHFCLRSGNCEAQTKAVIETSLDGFEDVDTAQPAPVPENKLGSLYAAIPMIESWCDAVRVRVRQALLEGRPVVRNDGLAYKLIEGRATRRTWVDEAEAESALLNVADESRVYLPRKVISPAMAEVLSKTKRPRGGQVIPAVITKDDWASLQHHITQGKAQPNIVLETDPNPALPPPADDFEEVPDNVDLFN